MDSYYFDVICVGAGGAGATAAISAAGQGAKVALLSKSPVGIGNTRASGGSIAGVGLEITDNEERFFQDLFQGGEGLGQPDIIRTFVDNARYLPEIVEDMGLVLVRDQEGLLGNSVIYKRGGHSCMRTIRIPSRGIALGNILRMAVGRAAISIFEEVIVHRLVWDGDRVLGVRCYDLKSGEWHTFNGKAVILATGGGGMIYYPHTTNTAEATGDGYALAAAVGAELINMELIQFQAFGMVRPPHMVGQVCGEPGHAGPYGRLLANDGSLVLENINILTRAELCKILSLALNQGLGSPGGGLFLDLSGNLTLNDGGKYMSMFKGAGGILERIRWSYGDKAARLEEPWEVAPTAHFFLGGIKTDENGWSGINGLYAVGEVQGGLHGANRLGSVALTENFVMGRKAGLAAADEASLTRTKVLNRKHTSPEQPDLPANTHGYHRPISLIRKLQNCMWQYASSVREQKGLISGLAEIERIKQDCQYMEVPPHKRFNTEVRDAIELEKMLLAAKVICQSALCREETRGSHVRLDFPEKWSVPRVTITKQLDTGVISTQLKEV